MKIEADIYRDVVKRRQIPRYAPDSTRGEGDWRDDALCAQTDPTLFHPEEKGASIVAARRICRQCPVTAECLEANLGEQYGVWGGTSAKQRAAIRKARSAGAA